MLGHVPVGETLDDFMTDGEVVDVLGNGLRLFHGGERLRHMTLLIVGYCLIIQTLGQSLLVVEVGEHIDARADDGVGGNGMVAQVVQLDSDQVVERLIVSR